MKVLKRGIMPDGTEIQIEDWNETYSFLSYGSTIGAYPKNRYGETFRTSRDFENDKATEKVFEELINGTKTLRDLEFVIHSGGRILSYITQL